MSSRAAAAVLLASVALAAAGCGGDTSGNQDSDQGVNVGAPINLADCTDWKDASVEERLGTVGQIREFTGGPIAGTDETGSVLDDQKAYDLFENVCSNTYARAFKLYKVYGRAAAFQSYADQASEDGDTP